MNKERLQEIKDSIDLQRETLIALNMQTLCLDEEMELYNEIIRLKKQKDDVVEYIKCLIKRLEEFDIPKRKETGAFWYQVMGELEELLRMLGEIDE